MTDTRDTKSLPYFFSILLILTLTILSACGKDNARSGATSGSGTGESTVPGSVDSGLYSDYGTGGSLPSASLVDLKDPSTQNYLEDALGAQAAEELMASLMGIENPTSLTAMSNDLGKALAILSLLTQKADQQARDELTALLKLIAAELKELKKSFSKGKMKAFGKKQCGRMAGIAKGAKERSNGKK